MKLVVRVYAALLVFLFASCGVETITVTPKLASPLAITLSNVGGGNNGIVIRFWAYNNETYFTGYNIYMAMTNTVLLNGSGYWANRADGSSNAPTLPYSPMSTATLISYTITNFTNAIQFTHNSNYYFYIKAYSSTYGVESKPSNITNILYLTN